MALLTGLNLLSKQGVAGHGILQKARLLPNLPIKVGKVALMNQSLAFP